MRMEELSEARYLKRADSVESYLLGLIQEYFQKTGTTPQGSMENIIEKCVTRMSEDLEYDGVGITGILLPGDTEARTGSVEITLEDLNGEPKIDPKKTAFNVDFGDMMNTACEGNDPRLSDAREPLEHRHTLDDIQGLNGKLSTIDGKVSRALSLAHDHDNIAVLNKIIYTGHKDTIDLADIENSEDRFRNEVDRVQDVVNNYDTADETRKQDILNTLNGLSGSSGSIQTFLEQSNNEHLEQAKAYTDEKCEEAHRQLLSMLSDYARNDDITSAISSLLNNTYTIVGSMDINITDYIPFASGHETREIAISQAILDEINRRGVSLSQCVMEATLKYSDGANGNVMRPVPYIYTCLESNEPIGSFNVKTVINRNSFIIESYISDMSSFNNEIHLSTLTVTFLSKQNGVGSATSPVITDDDT